jgi:hypothetical protein
VTVTFSEAVTVMVAGPHTPLATPACLTLKAPAGVGLTRTVLTRVVVEVVVTSMVVSSPETPVPVAWAMAVLLKPPQPPVGYGLTSLAWAILLWNLL